MPLWHIYHPEDVYSAEDKCALATRITGSTRMSACPGSMQGLSFTSCRRTRSLSAERQRTILSGFGLIRLLAQLLPSGARGGWNASTGRSIPSHASRVFAGRSILTKRQSILDHPRYEAAGPRLRG